MGCEGFWDVMVALCSLDHSPIIKSNSKQKEDKQPPNHTHKNLQSTTIQYIRAKWKIEKEHRKTNRAQKHRIILKYQLTRWEHLMMTVDGYLASIRSTTTQLLNSTTPPPPLPQTP